ncbi:SGNH/GDSL hydrolase family protein [Candidatus Peregrinibacteria bacterium]|nr:SGNH/GDSL hydrolase family protein [Candidatus Peregrinibacteria bacterium]
MPDVPKSQPRETIAAAPESTRDPESAAMELRNIAAAKRALVEKFRKEIAVKNRGSDNLDQVYAALEPKARPLLQYFGIENLVDFLNFINAESIDEGEKGYVSDRVKVIGDSQVEGMKYMGGLGETLGCSDHRGMGISFILKTLASKLHKNPHYLDNTDLLYVHAGGNSLWTLPLEEMKAQTQALSLLLHEKAAHVRVVFGTITPRQETIDKKPNKEKLTGKLLAFNDWLRSTFGSNCFDAFKVVEDPNRPNYQNPQFRTSKNKSNVHFNSQGYRTLAGAFLKRFKIAKGLES